MNFFQTTLLLFISTSLIAQDDFLTSLQNSDFKAQVRYFSMQRLYNELIEDPPEVYNQHHKYSKASNAIGGYIGFQTAPYYGFSVGTTLYTSQPIFDNPQSKGGLGLLKDDQSGYSVLGEAFISFEYNDNLLKIGRQKLDNYGFLSSMDIRMVPQTYEGLILENRTLKEITFKAALLQTMKPFTSTTFIDFVNGSQDLLRDKGIDRETIRGDFNEAYYDNEGNYVGPNQNLYLTSVSFNSDAVELEAWDYYCDNFVNSFYATGTFHFDTGSFKNSVGAQLVKQDDVGERVQGDINTYAYGAMLQSRYKDLRLRYAFNRVKYDENSNNGGTIIVNWGSNPLYNSLIYNGSEKGGTLSQSISLGYDLSNTNLSITLNASIFDLPDNLTDKFADQDNKEYDVIIQYTPEFSKKLHLKIEMMYVDFDTNYNFAAYEDYHGYDMLHTYDDILDLRFIVNYTF